MSNQRHNRIDEVKAAVAIMAYVLIWTFGTLYLVSLGLPGWAGAGLLALMFIVPMVYPNTYEVLYG